MPDPTLLLIDIQNDYFPGGQAPLEGQDAAAGAAARLLSAFRERGLPVVHLRHLSVQPGATFFLPGSPGAEIHEAVAPAADEAVFDKHYPNSFRETGLDEALREIGTKRLVVAGSMSHMCVDTTVRAAFDLGYECEAIHDACATMALDFKGVKVPAAEVHAAYMAALGQVFAKVLSAEEWLKA